MLIGMVVTSATVNAAEGDLPFKDVPAKSWYYDAVKYVYENGLMGGISADTFSPKSDITRAQLVTILYRLAGLSDDEVAKLGSYATGKFKDVKPSFWGAGAIGWAVKEGYVDGYADGTFKPNAAVKRQELAKLVVLFIQKQGLRSTAEPLVDSFKDAGSFQAWAADYIEQLRLTGLVGGDNEGNFNPKKSATRAEFATILTRFPGKDVRDPMFAKVESFNDTFLCGPHNEVFITGPRGSELTPEFVKNMLISSPYLLDLDPEIYEAIIDDDMINEIQPDYAGAGSGTGNGIEDFPLKVRNKVTGEETEEIIIPKIGFIKYLIETEDGDYLKYPGFPFCHDEDPMYDKIDEVPTIVDDENRIVFTFQTRSSVTPEAFSDQILAKLGLPKGIYRVEIKDVDDFMQAVAGEGSTYAGNGHNMRNCGEEKISFRIENLLKAAFYKSTKWNPDGSSAYDEAKDRDLTDWSDEYEIVMIKDLSDYELNQNQQSGTGFVYDGAELTDADAFAAWLKGKTIGDEGFFDKFEIKTSFDDIKKAAADGKEIDVDVTVGHTTSESENGKLPEVSADYKWAVNFKANMSVKDYGDGAQIKIDLKPVEKVTIDGVISDGEYYKVESDKIFKVVKPGSAD